MDGALTTQCGRAATLHYLTIETDLAWESKSSTPHNPSPTSQVSRRRTSRAGAATLNIGLFINAVIQFVIVAFVIFWVVRALNRLVHKEPPPPPPPAASEIYLKEIRDLLLARPEMIAAPPAATAAVVKPQ